MELVDGPVLGLCDSASRDAMIRSCSGLNTAKGRSNAACNGGSSAWRSPGFVPETSEWEQWAPAPAPLPFLGLFNRKLRQKALTGSNTLICNRATNVLSP